MDKPFSSIKLNVEDDTNLESKMSNPIDSDSAFSIRLAEDIYDASSSNYDQSSCSEMSDHDGTPRSGDTIYKKESFLDLSNSQPYINVHSGTIKAQLAEPYIEGQKSIINEAQLVDPKADILLLEAVLPKQEKTSSDSTGSEDSSTYTDELD